MSVVAVVGSRGYQHAQRVAGYVDVLSRAKTPPTVLSGGARGVDTWSVDAAEERGLNWLVCEADWSRGVLAGFERNIDIVREADYLVAFWDGSSRGTAHAVVAGFEKGIPVTLYAGMEPAVVIHSPRDDSLPAGVRRIHEELERQWGEKLPRWEKQQAERPVFR